MVIIGVIMYVGCGCIVPWSVFLVQAPAIQVAIDTTPAGFSEMDMRSKRFSAELMIFSYF